MDKIWNWQFVHKPKVHFEAPSSAIIHKEMSAFIEWFNTSHKDTFFRDKPILRAAIVQLWFVSIHPFEDGNGRIARALVEKSIWQSIGHPFLFALSHTIQAHRKACYTALEDQNKSNTIDVWLSYFSKTLIEAVCYTEQKVTLIIKKELFFRKYAPLLNDRQIKVINKMFDHGLDGFKGGLSAKNYCSITGTSTATATRDLQKSLQMNVLRKE